MICHSRTGEHSNDWLVFWNIFFNQPDEYNFLPPSQVSAMCIKGATKTLGWGDHRDVSLSVDGVVERPRHGRSESRRFSVGEHKKNYDNFDRYQTLV